MSGLEALAVFGLACNVMTVVSFAHETASLCKKAFETGTADPSLVKNAEESVKVFDDLETSLNAAPKPFTEDEQKLLDIAKETLAVGRELKAEVDKIARDSGKGKLGASVKSAVMAKLKAKKIENLENTVQNYQRILETRLLTRICSKSNAISLQQDERFSQIDYNLQSFITKLAQGQTQLKQLLGQEVASVKDHVTITTSQSRMAITEHISSESTKARQDFSRALVSLSTDQEQQQSIKARERFLASLKFETMNERRNQIPPCHKGTFEWVFRENYFSGSESSDGDPSSGGSSDYGSSDGSLTDDNSSDHESLNIQFESYPRLCQHGNREGWWDCFPCWLESRDTKWYWINGKAGSGKSTLMKFLVSDSRTKGHLRDQNGDTLILSHFLWSSGLPMQKSIKGILLNLLHQLLSAKETVLDLVMSKFNKTLAKDVPGDWSTEELELTILSVLAAVGHPLCVFLDGIDEMSEDDSPTDLLDLVLKLGALPNVKVCVSSRPEPVFKQRLQSTPHLRVQDLTRLDMENYVEDKLKPIPGLTKEEVRDLRCEVCLKADGVFLWVTLAVKSLLRGLSCEDTFAELFARLRVLPNGIQQLYSQMWERLNEDKISYREDAALYVYFVLEFHGIMHPKLPNQRENLLESSGAPLIIFHIMAATDSSFMDKILGDDTGKLPSANVLQAKCNSASRRLEARTAGLLEVSPWSGRLGFIHRSAPEFFQNTEAGKRILEHVKLAPEQRIHVLLRSILAYIRLQLREKQQSEENLKPWATDHRIFCASHFVLCTHLLMLAGDISVGIGLQILADARKLYERGHWWYEDENETLRPDFNGIAAALGILDFTAPLLQSMLGQPSENPSSSSYLSYMFAMACSKNWIAYRQIAEAKSRQLSWFVNQNMVCSIPTVIPKLRSDQFNIAMTPAMVLMRTILESQWRGIPAAPEVFSKFLFLDGFLDKTVFICLTSHDGETTTLDMTMRQQYHDKYSQFYVEVNVVFLLRLYLRLAYGVGRTFPSMESLVDKMRGARHRKYFKVLGSRIFSRGGPWRLTRPVTDEDSTYVMSCLESVVIRWDKEGYSYYHVPELWESMEKMASRGINMNLSNLYDDIISRGLVIRGDWDVKDWPPKLTSTEESNKV